MMSKIKVGFRLTCYMVIAISYYMSPLRVSALESLPVFGSDAQNTAQYDSTVQDAGRSLRWNLRFMSDNEQLNKAALDELADPVRNVSHMIITLETQASLTEILNGKRDRNLKRISEQMYSWQKVHPNVILIVRLFPEMNGDWSPWGFGKNHNGNSVEQFIPAWKHVRTIMRGEFPNLAFMWCPNIMIGHKDSFSTYYPGNDQVEYLGLDGYNHSSSVGGWKTMQQVFHNSLVAIRAIPGIENKPLVIAETATTEPDGPSAREGHSKAEWFGSTYGNMGWWLHHEAPEFGVTAVLYFNYKKVMTFGNKPSTVNYLIYDSSLPTAKASREAFRKSIYDLP